VRWSWPWPIFPWCCTPSQIGKSFLSCSTASVHHADPYPTHGRCIISSFFACFSCSSSCYDWRDYQLLREIRGSARKALVVWNKRRNVSSFLKPDKFGKYAQDIVRPSHFIML
jgi:hypothetical protein